VISLVLVGDYRGLIKEIEEKFLEIWYHASKITIKYGDDCVLQCDRLCR